MKTVHFDVDRSSQDQLYCGRKVTSSLNQANAGRYSQSEVVTIKSGSLIDKKVLTKMPRLKLICLRVTGYDNVDLSACQERKVAVYYVPDYCTDAVAEHVFALLLSAVRKILLAQHEVGNGSFSYRGYQGYTLAGKTFGVIGTGKIGRQVIKIAKAFGMKILAFDIAPDKKAATDLGFRDVALDVLLKQADIISLHIPLVPHTFHLINEKSIKKMKPGVILINVSRGGIIDTNALIKRMDKFRYVCLDVLEDEKHFTKKNPLLQFEDKVIITPHCAFFTEMTVSRACQETKDNIKRFIEGDSHNRLA